MATPTPPPAADAEEAADESSPRGFHRLSVGSKTVFEIDVRYAHLKPVGSGSYGLVCAGDDTLTGRRVAIKRIHKVFQDLIDAKRILREIMLLRHLGGHENVMGLVDLMTLPPGTTDFRDLYIITELFECDLDRIISSKQPLTESHVQYFIYQILRGLKYIHSANVIHRDLKPSNLLVNANCDLAICDFGLARGISAFESRLTEYVVTRWYRAPELLLENRKYGKEVDIWSCGCILAEILGRKPLFRGRDYLEQLLLIIEKLGSPSQEDLAFIDKPRAVEAIRKFGEHSPISFELLFPKASPDAIDLLTKMLVFNPAKRITVEDALSHPFLKDLHSVRDEPVASESFDFDFERDYPEEIPKPALQDLMYRQVLGINEEERKRAARVAAASATKGTTS